MINKVSGTEYMGLRSQTPFGLIIIVPLGGFMMLDKSHNFFGSQYPHQKN